jgi:hypothetical protein
VAPLDEVRARGGASIQAAPDGDWLVRMIPGGYSTKTYRCPGCDHEIVPGVAHVVVWPADGRGDATDRRHWHTSCWRSRGTRAPRIMRHR